MNEKEEMINNESTKSEAARQLEALESFERMLRDNKTFRTLFEHIDPLVYHNGEFYITAKQVAKIVDKSPATVLRCTHTPGSTGELMPYKELFDIFTKMKLIPVKALMTHIFKEPSEFSTRTYVHTIKGKRNYL
jgi:hypothetical protein